jgi:lysophospholipase L1-like esterase
MFAFCAAQKLLTRNSGRSDQGRMFSGDFGTSVPAGSPAPVPPEVAIPRPTIEEAAEMNTALQEFINDNTSANKDLLKKYASLIKIKVPRTNSATVPTRTFVRSLRHDRFVEIANNMDFDILFHGDSITDWWQQREPRGGKEVFDKYFGDMKIANFAVSSDTTQGLLWGLQNGEGQGHKPKAVMLMVGTNNAAYGNTGPEIAEGVGSVVLELRRNFPDAKILLLAIFPRGANENDPYRRKNEQANKIIAKLHDGKHVFFMDINDKFLNADGSLKGFRFDNLHPNAEGYEIWAEAVADTLKRWIK